MIRGIINRARWGDEEVEIPPLKTSNNGWYYGYDGETLARGDAGRRMAQEAAKQRVQRVLAEHDWKVPDEVWPVHSPGYNSQGLEATVNTGLGPIRLVYDPRYNRMTVSVHQVLSEIERHHRGESPLQGEINNTLPSHMVAKNIWEYGRQLFPILSLVDTPEIPVKYRLNGEFTQEDGSITLAKDAYSYFRTLTKDELEKTRGEKISDLIDLFKVYGHNDIRILTTYAPNLKGYGSYQVVIGVEVKVKDPEHEEAHTVTIRSSGEASVKCGYRDSEQKYLEYQKRQLAGWMQEELGVAGDEFKEITFD